MIGAPEEPRMKAFSRVSLLFLLLFGVALAADFSETLSTMMGGGQEEEAVRLILEQPEQARKTFEEMETLALSGVGDPILPVLILNFISRTFEARQGETELRDRLLLTGMLAPEHTWEGGPLAKVETAPPALDPELEEGLNLKQRVDLAVRFGSVFEAEALIRPLQEWALKVNSPGTLELKAETLIGGLAVLRLIGSQTLLEDTGAEVLRMLEANVIQNSAERRIEVALLLAAAARRGERPADLKRHLKLAETLLTGAEGPSARRGRFVVKTYLFELECKARGTSTREEIRRAHGEAWQELEGMNLDRGRNWLAALDGMRFWAGILAKAGAVDLFSKQRRFLLDLAQTEKRSPRKQSQDDNIHLLTGPTLPILFTSVDLELDLVGVALRAEESQAAVELLTRLETVVATTHGSVAKLRETVNRTVPTLSLEEDGTRRLIGRIAEERGRLDFQNGKLKPGLQRFSQALTSYQASGDVLSYVDLGIEMILVVRSVGESEKALKLTEEILAVSRTLGYWPGTARALVIRADLSGEEVDLAEATEMVETYLDGLQAESRVAEATRKRYLSFLQPVRN